MHNPLSLRHVYVWTLVAGQGSGRLYESHRLIWPTHSNTTTWRYVGELEDYIYDTPDWLDTGTLGEKSPCQVMSEREKFGVYFVIGLAFGMLIRV